jgi:hypothetical protein
MKLDESFGLADVSEMFAGDTEASLAVPGMSNSHDDKSERSTDN